MRYEPLQDVLAALTTIRKCIVSVSPQLGGNGHERGVCQDGVPYGVLPHGCKQVPVEGRYAAVDAVEEGVEASEADGSRVEIHARDKRSIDFAGDNALRDGSKVLAAVAVVCVPLLSADDLLVTYVLISLLDFCSDLCTSFLF